MEEGNKRRGKERKGDELNADDNDRHVFFR
jgi:hypothetical protein